MPSNCSADDAACRSIGGSSSATAGAKAKAASTPASKSVFFMVFPSPWRLRSMMGNLSRRGTGRVLFQRVRDAAMPLRQRLRQTVRVLIQIGAQRAEFSLPAGRVEAEQPGSRGLVELQPAQADAAGAGQVADRGIK